MYNNVTCCNIECVTGREQSFVTIGDATMTILPSLLRDKIKSMNISEREASRRSGVSPTTIGRILKGESVDVDTLVKVCNWLGVSPSIVLDAYRPDNLEARIAAILQARPDLANVFQGVMDRIESDKIPSSVMDDVIAYINYRTSREISNGSDNNRGAT